MTEKMIYLLFIAIGGIALFYFVSRLSAHGGNIALFVYGAIVATRILTKAWNQLRKTT